jgi:Flp pilus assembly protein TadG
MGRVDPAVRGWECAIAERPHSVAMRGLAARGRSVRQRGLALVETALVLLILVTLVFAAIEYGWMFTTSGYLVNAARHGARLGVRPDITTAEVRTEVDAMMTRARLGNSGYTVTISPANVASAQPGQTVSVEVSVPYNRVTLTGFPVPRPNTLRFQATMVKEGP